MSFDTSRYTFNPLKNYNGVVMEQGRVQNDADWNEWLAELGRRFQAGTLDTLGRAVYPMTTPFAFKLDFDASGNLTIGPGRMYIDGLLAENFGDPTAAVWDPALAEMSNTPQPPPASDAGAIKFADQPYYSPAGTNATLPTSGTYLAYLDVWTRAVDYLQDPALIDSAINIDTTGRLQTVWQVQLASVGAGADCSSAGTPWPAPSGGRLTTAPVNSVPSGPCCLTNNTGYTGRENQHYRVEILKPGPLGTATFVWSRDNASVETGVTAITPVTNSVLVSASQLSVLSMGRDQVLGFHPGDWIEILDNNLELAGLPGELHRIDTIDFAARTITLDSSVNSANFPVSGTGYQTDPKRCTRIRRWDQSGKVFASDGTTVITDLGATGSTGEIPVPSSSSTAVILESGITVSFATPPGGSFNTGDFWTFTARTDGTIEILNQAPPRGIHHHYVPLAVVDFTAGKVNSDCRVPWNPGGKEDGCGCCTVTVGDGVTSTGQHTSINAALKALPPQGGEVCILPGRYFEHVFIVGLSNVVVRGCGYQTRLASPSFAPVVLERLDRPSITAGASTTGATIGVGALGSNADGTFNAVISISRSRHIKLLSFAVEADSDEVGILIDGTGKLITNPNSDTSSTAPSGSNVEVRSATTTSLETLYRPVVYDVSILGLFLTGSTLPAILARRVELLHIADNRILMANTRSLWPSVYVNGVEMHLDRNYVGIQNASTMLEWLPTTVVGDLRDSSTQLQSATAPTTSSSGSSSSTTTGDLKIPLDLNYAKLLNVIDFNASLSIANHPGGIMIAGPSQRVFICENLIEGGRFNGITLGSYAVVDSTGLETKRIIGIHTVSEDDCCNNGTLEPPGSSSTGDPGTSIVAGGELVDIFIDRNRILNMGLCGIGPVGIFDLRRALEVISIENLVITNNMIRNTVLRAVAPVNTFGTSSAEQTATPAAGSSTANLNFSGTTFSSISTLGNGSSSPYAAICVPDVQNLVIHDNEITNFGAKPGIAGNGIFVLNGEVVDISRNRINETRDWTSSVSEPGPTAVTLHGGIMLALVTPTLLRNSYTSSNPYTANIYEPGTPALRLEENTVRVALGQALVAFGFGVFAIADNHFACGGMVRGTREQQIAQTVLILNLGASIETSAATGFRENYNQASTGAQFSPYAFSSGASSRAFMASGSGTVLFANNICQLEARASRQFSVSSITVLSRDHIIFSGNQSWVDSTVRDVFSDALLAGGSLNVTSNRFQDSPVSVFLSGVTFGVMNVTSQNISTFCLLVEGPSSFTVDRDNLALINMVMPGICGKIRGQ